MHLAHGHCLTLVHRRDGVLRLHLGRETDESGSLAGPVWISEDGDVFHHTIGGKHGTNVILRAGLGEHAYKQATVLGTPLAYGRFHLHWMVHLQEKTTKP